MVNVMEFRSSKYGWNFRNSHRWIGTRFSLNLAGCAVAVFWLGFSQEYHYSMARVPALRDCSCQINAKANENIGLDLKLATILENASVGNSQTCESVATLIPETSQVSSCYVSFRFFVTATDRENGTFPTINRDFKQRQRGRQRERHSIRENPKSPLRMPGGERVDVQRLDPTWV